jgi:Spy/CpxP family protein refolding chaperone
MKTSNRKTIMLAALAIVAFTAGLALAQGPGLGRSGKGQGKHCFEGPGQRWERMAEHLELTEEQQATIEELREKNREANQDLRKQMARVRNELEGELLKDDVDAGKALELQRKLGELRTEMQSNRLETRLAVREQLTPAQRDKMLAMKAGAGKRGGRHGRGGHGAHRGGWGQGHGGPGDCRFDDD